MNNLHYGLWAKVRAFTCLLIMLSLSKAYAQKPTPGGNAYFTSAPIIYVNIAATGANTGTSWANAFTDLQLALKEARSTEGPDQIWVAKGTYKPTNGTNRKASFTIPDKTALFGGFIGNEKSLNQRDWKANETILNGNIGQRDNSDNSFHVVSAFDLITGAWIDGFSVRNGYADGSSNNRLGAGLLILPTERPNTNRMRIANCLFNANITPNGSGGAIYGANLFSEILDCTFRENAAGRDGGAIMLSPGTGESRISRSYFTENNAIKEDGGAVAAFADLVEIDNSVFLRNTAQRGGGIYVGTNGALDMANATFVNNRTGADTGSSLHNRGKARVVSSIFFKDRQFPILSEGQISVTYSNVHGGFPGTGNIDADPLYHNPSAGDFSLTTGSPSINTGSAVSLSGSFDILGNARIVDAAIDMGAYEFLKEEEECSGARLYVNLTATGANNGSSWANAFVDLQDALATAGACEDIREIWVAEGSYKPTAFANRATSFNLVNNVAVFGGFDGTETLLSQRDWVTHPTILSGDIPGANSYRVVLGSNLSSNTVLDGFIITESDMLRDGPSDPAIPFGEFGVGMLLRASSGFSCTPIIKNCTFRKIRSRTGSGAMALLNANPTVDDCYFDDNYCEEGVGAIYATGNHVLRITDTYFYSNSGEFGSGAIEAEVDRLELENCVFEDNRSGDEDGGAIELMPNTDMRVVNSTFYANGTHTGRGAIFSFRSNNTVDIFNSIFWGNEDTDGNPLDPSDPNYYIIGDKSALTISYSIFERGWPGVGNLDLDPQFASTAVSPANLRLQLTSPAINAGINTVSTEPLDIDGNPRIANLTVDMGAYEFSDRGGECPELEVIFVDITATGLNNGSSWTDAFVDLQDALTLAEECGNIEEIWVAQGTYLPSQTMDQSATFALLDNLELYGGFNGTETERDQRDWVLYPTILSGDLDQDGDVFLTEPNSYHILTADEIQRCIVDGFIIRDGYTEANIAGSLLGGAGLAMTGTSTERVVMVVRNSVFINNSSYSGSGGAVFSIYSTTYFENVRFENNYGEESAGAIYVTRSRHTYQRCSFSGNLADDQHGGAISSFYSNLFIHNSLFYGNQANIEAGGLFLFQTNLEATNSTFVSNNAPNRGAISVGFNSGGSIVNSIFWDNGGFLEDENLALAQAYLYDPTFSLDITYSILEYGWPGIANLDADPLFVNAPIQDYRLSVGSPGINSGLNSGTIGLQDLAGNVRIEGPTVDRGAFEYNADQTPCPEKGIIFVDITATGMNNGLSWSDAFTDLQYALNLAAVCPVQEIWVAQGTYLPSQSLDQSATFNLLSDLGLYGGFQGIETERNQRNWVLFPTILSGDLDQDGDVFLTEPNAYHILTAEGIQNCHVDGFIIQDGFVEGNIPSIQESGSGLAVIGTQLDSASMSVQNCLFTNNSSYSSSGGAVFSEFAHVSFTNVEFAGNYGEESAGAVLTRDSYHIFSRCLFRNNLADDASGGAILSIGSILNIDNSLFYSNFANIDGGAISASNDPLRITNSTFANNSAPFSGAIVAGQNASGFIINSIFWDNGGDEDPNLPPAQSYLFDPNFGLTVTYSIMEFGWPGVGNLDVDPLFINTGSGNYRLGNGSPASNSGLNSAVIGTRDLDGNFRIVGNTVDRGAYETQLGFGSSNLITGLILMNALTQEEITEIRDGETIQLPNPLPPINVVAKSEGNDIQSVVFELRGALSLKNTENAKLWALFGDEEGKLNPGFLFNGEYKLSVTPYSDENGSGEAGESYDVGFQIVGVAPSFSEEVEKMSAYPNPNNGEFSLKLPESWASPASVRITDKMGNVVWAGTFQNPKIETQIQLPQLFDGVYMLHAVSGKQVETLRLVITK